MACPRERASGQRVQPDTLDTVFTGDNFTDPTATLRRLFSDPATRPDGLLVMAVRDRGLAGVLREAVAAGVHWVFLNAIEDDLDAIRRERPEALIATVCPDEVETGRIQGREICALVPTGRRVIYVQGNPRSLTSRQRTAGMQEAVAGSGRNVVLAGGGWSGANQSYRPSTGPEVGCRPPSWSCRRRA